MKHWYQTDFSGGLVTDSPIPNSLSTLTNAYIYNSNEIRKRGGKDTVATLSSGASAVASRDCLVTTHRPEDGYLLAFTGPDGASSHNVIEVMDLSGPTTTDVSGGFSFPVSGTFTAYAPQMDYDYLVSRAKAADEVLIAGLSKIIRWYGGNYDEYNTGTISGTAGTTTITGSGTSWSSNVEAGMYLIEEGNSEIYRISSVDSDTSITLDRNIETTMSGETYLITPVTLVTTNVSSLQGASEITEGLNRETYSPIAYHGDRLFWVESDDSSYSQTSSTLRWSGTSSEAASGASSYAGVQNHNTNAYAEIAPGLGGGIIGLASYGNELLIFKRDALYALRGAVATDGTDLGASVELIDGQTGIDCPDGWDYTPAGICFSHRGTAYVYSGGQVRSLSSGSISNTMGFTTNATNVSYIPGENHRVLFFQGNTTAWEYDFNRRAWARQEFDASYPIGAPRTVYESSAFTQYTVSIQQATGGLLDWLGDRDRSSDVQQDGGVGSEPKLVVRTHPIHLNAQRPRGGRPSIGWLHGKIDTTANNGHLDLDILGGHDEAAITGSPSYNLEESDTASEQMARLKVSNSPEYSVAKLQVTQSGPSGDTSIFGLGLSYTESRAP